MDEEERKSFSRWVDSSPYKPAGITYLELWNIKMGNGKQKNLGDYEDG